MAKNYDLFLERMKQKYNVPQTTYKPQTALQKQNTLSKTKDTFYNPSKAEEPQKQNGFDDLNLWNKFGAMYHQARTSFETSFLDLGEGVIDAILTGVGSFADWVGADDLSDTMTDWTKSEWLSALPEQDWFNDYFGLDFLFSEQAQEVGRRDEALPEIVDNVASGIGSAVGYGLLNMVPVVGPALAWMGGGGAAAEEALNEGASNTEAMLYGGAVGGVEFATEKFLGKGLEKVGLGLGKFAGWGKGTSTTAKQVGKSALSKIASNFGKNFFEEGMEEVVSEIVDPLLKKGTYKRDESLKELWGEQVTAENLIQTFLIGGLTGGVMEGANIAGGIVSSGGIKNWDIRQEAQQLQIINSQMEEAILKGDEQKLSQLQAQKEQAIKSVETKFDNFVNDLKNKPKAKGLESTLQYATQRDMSQEDITLQAAEKVLNGVKNKKIVDDNGKKTEVKKINVEYSGNDANGKQVASHYNPNNNTVYLNKENLKTITSALETISHEVGHAIHTSGLNTNFINQMITNFNDFDSLIDNQANKGKVNSIEDVISYYEIEKGYGKVLEDSNLLKQRMQENNISKEQAYQELRDNYMLEEIANDIFSKKYFSNLLELQAVISGAKPNKIRKIKEAYRKLYANTNNKPENYKEVMKIFTDGINQNYERFYENLEKNQQAQKEQTTDKKYKSLSEEELENAVDSNGNKLSKEQIEYFKNSKVRDENGNLVRAYHTSANAGFTIFDANQDENDTGYYRYKGKYVSFFTNDYQMSSSYVSSGSPVDFDPYNPNTEEIQQKGGIYFVYLNIEKPLIIEGNNNGYSSIPFKELENSINSEVEKTISVVSSLINKNSDNTTFTNYENIQKGIIKELNNKKFGLDKFVYEDGYISVYKRGQYWSGFNLPTTDDYNKINDIIKKYKERISKNDTELVKQSILYDIIKEVGNFSSNGTLGIFNFGIDMFVESYENSEITDKADDIILDLENLNKSISEDIIKKMPKILNDSKVNKFTTNDIVNWALEQGEKYDGVIFKNIKDYGKNGEILHKPNDVYVTLKSPNQIKDVRNQNPTDNYDIRYKLSDDIKTPSDVQKAIETLSTYEDQLQENKITQQQYDSRSKIYTRDINNTIKKAYEYLEGKYEQGLTQSEIDEAKAFDDLKNGWLPPEAKEYDFSKFTNAKLVEKELTRQEKIDVMLKDKTKVDGFLEVLWDIQIFEDLYEKYESFEDFFKENEGNSGLAYEYLNELSDKDIDKEYDWYLEQKSNQQTTKPIQEKETPKFERNKDVDEKVTYDFSELKTKDDFIKVALDIYKRLNQVFNGTTEKKVSDTQSLYALKSTIESETATNDQKQKAYDLYKERYDLAVYYSKRFDELVKVAKNVFPPISKNKDSKEFTKFQKEFNEARANIGYMAISSTYKNLPKPSDLSFAQVADEEVLKAKKEELKTIKGNRKKHLEKIVKEYQLIDEEQKGKYDRLTKEIESLTIENYKEQKSVITEKLDKFEEELKPNRAKLLNVNNKKESYNKKIDRKLKAYPNEEQKVKNSLNELNKMIDELTIQNYADEATISKIDEAYKQFEKLIESNENQSKQFDKDNAGYISAFDYHYKGLLNDFKVGEELGKLEQKGKYKEAYEKGLEKLNSINNTIENSESLEDPSSMGLKDLISHLKKEAQKQEKELRPYIYDRVISDLETKLQEIEAKLAKLDEYVQKLEGLKTKKEQQDQKEKELKEAEELKKKQKEEKKALEEKQKAEEEAKAKAEQEAKEKKEATTKTKTKKQPKEVIKFIRQTVYLHTESAKSVKSEADKTQLKKYTKQTCEDLIDMVGDMMSTIGRKKRIKTRVYFAEGGKKKAIDDLFKAFNTLASDPKALSEKVIEILKTGMEFQMPDYTISLDKGKIKKQSRKVYMTDENLWLQEDKKYVGMVELVNQELVKMVQDTIEGKGSPTLLAREISKRTQELEDRITELEDQIDILVDQINNSKETVEVKIENATNNEELTKVNNELNKTNRKINQLEKELQKFTSKKEKVISDLKTKNAELKTDLLKQTKQVEKITKKNIELKTDLEGVYQFRNTKEEAFLKRLMKQHFNLAEDMDLETVEKVSEKYNKGDIDGVVDVLIDFLKGSKVYQITTEIDEKTQQPIESKEKVPFTDVYNDNLVGQYREAFKQDIVDRINNKRTTKQSALPKALQEIEKLRTKIKTNKETAKRLTTLKSLMRNINNLARNKRPSALFNNIDKRFEAIAEQLGRYSQTTMLNGNFREILKEFKKFLTEDRFDGQTFQEMTGLEFPQELFEQLDQLENVQGQITLYELDLYNKILSAIEVYISKGTGSRKITIDEKEYILEEYVAEAIKEQQEILNKIGIDAEHFGKLLQTVDPRVVFKILSGFNENSKLYKLFEELQKGDTNSMTMQMELQEKLVDFNKKHKKFKKKVLGKKVEINGINATNGQFISIYKSLQREHAKKHILNSGIDLNGKVIRFTEQQLNDLEIAIENQLELKKDGSLMKEYFELTKDFFKKSGEVKAKIDELLYGYADIEQGEYFPIQISSLEFNRTLGEKKYVSKMAASFNYSWQKAVIGDLGAIKIGNVQDIIDLHSRQVADYYGFGLPLDLFNQIYSFKVYDKNSNRFVNLKRLINDRFGTNKKTGKYLAEDYIKILFDDIRGVNTYTGEVDGLFKRIFGSLRKKYSTYILGANLKTAGVQLAAIPAARKYLSLKSMRKALGKIDWDKYPLPKLGEYRTYDKTILKSETINDKISEIADKFGIIMTLTDQFTIKYAWKAALYETNFDIDKATKLFEKIVRETQPQYSAIERSALMRSSNDLVKLLTQFQSQNNKNFSTIMEMIYKAKYYKKLGMKLSKEDVQQFRRSIESIVFQGVFATAIAYLFKFLLHDLDDEDLDPLAIIGEFFNNNILGLIPLMNNIKLDLTGEGKLGYVDIYETNLGMIDKLYDAVVSLGQWTNPDKTLEHKIYNSMNVIGVVTGIPTENLYKYSIAILKWVPFTKDMAFSWDANIKGISMTNKSEINEALKNGKINVAKQYYQTYTRNILELDDYTTNVLFNLYKKGFTNAYIKQVPKTLVIDNEQVQIDRDKFIKTYSKLTPQLNKLVKSTAFNGLTDEEKEKTLSKLINVYYSLAKKEQMENAEYSDLELIFKYCNNFKSTNLSYLVHISNIEETKTKTRKEMVQRYIQTLPLSAGEKYLLYVLSGYSISDKNRKILRSFLSASGMPTKQINILLG